MSSLVSIKEFENILNELVTEIVSDLGTLNGTAGFSSRLEEMLRYNLFHHLEIRGFLIPSVYCEVYGDVADEEDIRLSYILGCCWQIMLTFYTMMDDIFDDDVSRWGKPTWHVVNNKTPIATNDAVCLEQAVYRLLGKYFSQLPNYTQLLKYFTDATWKYFMGQNFELFLAKQTEDWLDHFTTENYRACVNHVTYIAFAGRFHLAMILAGCEEHGDIWKLVDNICYDMAYFFNVRDDLQDSFGENLINPVADVDIRMGKCKWLIVKAIEICNAQQRKQLTLSYGKNDDDNVKVVKDIYVNLRIPELCKQHLSILESALQTRIESLMETGHGIGKLCSKMFMAFVSYRE